ncbi:MAG TPA: hypothetical protein VGH51_17180 [Candidatus Angelobacter sp.]
MQRLVHKSVLLATIVCVLLVFLAPTIDLPETALRANQNAQKVMICITLLNIELLFAVVLMLFRVECENPLSMFSARTSSLLCTLLC